MFGIIVLEMCKQIAQQVQGYCKMKAHFYDSNFYDSIASEIDLKLMNNELSKTYHPNLLGKRDEFKP